MTPKHDPGLPRPAYETDLTQTPLPEILVIIYRHNAPGTLVCRRGNEMKEIFVDRGNIIFATSNQVRDSLGDRLLNDGLITREQYDESVRRLVATGKRQGTVLTEMNVLDPSVMLEAVREQIQEIVWSVFGWDGGKVTFTPGRERHREFVRLDIPIPQAVVEGARHMPDAKALLARVGTKTTLVTATGAAVEGLKLGEDEAHLLAAADGKRSLGELVSVPPLSASINARLLYAFFLMRLIAVQPAGGVRVKVKTDPGTRSIQ